MIAIVNMVDAGSKAHDIEVQFGIPARDVNAKIGIGLYLVVIGGIGLVAAGLQAEDELVVTSTASAPRQRAAPPGTHVAVPGPGVRRRRWPC